LVKFTPFAPPILCRLNFKSMFLYQFNYLSSWVVPWLTTDPTLASFHVEGERKGVNLTKKGVNLKIAYFKYPSIFLATNWKWNISTDFNLRCHPLLRQKILLRVSCPPHTLLTFYYLTPRSVSSLNNPQNSEMIFCENMKVTCWKSS
jgi:hypothetical protein